MSKFHSTVSRRNFMKGLGLAGAGLGAASAAAPVFHDLDEVAASPGAEWKRPWYIKHLDHGQATVPIEWNTIMRRDQSMRIPELNNAQIYMFMWRDTFTNAERDNIIKEYAQEYQNKDWQGDTVRDSALRGAASAYSHAGGLPQKWYDIYGTDKTEFLGTERSSTPQERGVPRYSGTPEEALRVVRSAARVIGAMDVSCIELDSNTKKLILAKDRSGYTYEWRDVEEAYIDGKVKVLPNKCKYLITWTECQPTELTYTAPVGLAGAGASISYTRGPRVAVMLQEFIRGLGYIPINGYSFFLCPTNPIGALSGMGEHARMGNILISPDYGAMLRGMWQILTDLPIAPTQAIDAGIYKFCHTCKICADYCPFDSLQLGDASYEVDPTWRAGRLEGAYGFKGWWQNNYRCVGCRACQARCPFNSTKEAWIHEVVFATLATIGGSFSAVDNFLARMEEAFHYGPKDPEKWWDLPGDPTFGVSTKWTQH